MPPVLRHVLVPFTSIALASAGCGGRPWPTTPVSAADPGLASRGFLTVDVLPMDVAVWADPGTISPDAVRGQVEAQVLNTALDTLSKRSFGIGAVVDWSGNAGPVAVLGQRELQATVSALAGYGAASSADEQPVLPVQLGQATGADTTLYVGGWAYVGKQHESRTNKVAKGVAIALVAITVVVAVVLIAEALSDDSNDSKTGDKKKGGAAVRDDREEAVASVRDHRRGSTTTPAASVRDHRSAGAAANRPLVRDHRGAGFGDNARDHRSTGSGDNVRDHRSAGPMVRDHRGAQDSPGGLLVRDHRGGSEPRSTVGVDLGYAEDLEIYVRPPPEPGESRLYLEMTLVDNKTGRVLWHAHQTFPANATRPGDAERAARVLLASLPSQPAH